MPVADANKYRVSLKGMCDEMYDRNFHGIANIMKMTIGRLDRKMKLQGFIWSNESKCYL